MEKENPEIWTIKDVRDMLLCVLILAFSAFVINGIMLETSIANAVEELPGQIDARILSVDNHLTGQIETAIGDLNGRAMQSLDMVDRQVTGTRMDLKTEIEGLRSDLTGTVLVTLDKRIESAQSDANAQLTVFNGSMSQTGAALAQTANTYNSLPGLLGARLAPAYASLEPEITCRHPDGTGYGGCWHSALTGLMNESKVTLGQITVASKEFPSLTHSFAGISKDVNRFTDKAVAPCRGWCIVKQTLHFGVAGIEAAGAAGAF